MPRPLIFDLFHTLVPGSDAERDRVVGEMALMVGVEPSALVAAYHATWRDRMTGWDVAETVRILAGRLGGTPTEDQVARAAAHRRELAVRLLDRVPETTLAALDALRAQGHPIGLISNATAETAEAWPVTRLARRIDVAVFSCDVRLAKPDPAIYRLTAGRLGVDPTDCVFVGDGADGELAGAAAVGMRVFRTAEHNDSDPAWTGRPLATLGELAALLR
ncbi:MULTISPECIES: HAD family hydrolase [Micromonospora]|uniref:HAD family hydrolase n=1 Tax=Micromonospora solifontis TaxID=2487138 RepID=A0ABX9WKU0_9ACTN|nr:MULTISPECIES: HAD-IA family hydrolase [Micromonospora]NES14829.1 HAD-IA family hydrolase [Micromonospora sp. PPF5-17B]NES35393.1 HAD-IA family hydrolase [Micromonospora solifontis]NES56125.1 HAD-IA family hydrolase [Micromonospora sp. PPF5-6]RNM00923.1 HAD family hydrolase [Micromonospora solifontis]